ncbi:MULTISPECIES: MFS transporter [Chryseobacterium]|uniref:ACS family hexuronate transporter-like MFS transporter n=2 Tax=Chryseobacterium TaxID=59732 RepID=A0ABU0TIR9_9FLAO|nr:MULTISPECIES: MFS transporter [Chryseobacterium]MDQ1096063.1 ACS family hexuronate transporter-like MFS transporter [Chryseobacterium camelliae]MDR6087345.1 ACS family hexuronate transporter-like MFS transporter [Chryseobacterium sp. SORGH_AS_0909]MDR6131720.1 ACS family hexuronate transporter-like MFS transporter [Chryseobacterium sp. SORGH_AS_1175]MDT3406133.1 ACS family hexuronate transporter-like MFS transporter [Pseudacidovorax intermedius]
MQAPKNQNIRWFMLSLVFLATTINYLDRQVMGLLKPVLEKEFSWDEKDYSYIVMAFTATYAVGYLAMGRFIDRVGTKIGYAVSLIVWSLASIGHGFVKSTVGFLVARSTLGISEAGNFPAAIKSVAEWFPKKERALATGIFNSGATVGAILAPLLVPFILGHYGWRQTFVWIGALGLLWIILWWRFYTIPEKTKRLSPEELRYIKSDQDGKTEEQSKVPLSEILKYKVTWSFAIGKIMTDPIWYFFMFWLPAYFADVFKMDLTKPSIPLIIIYSGTTIGSIGGGYLSSMLIKKGWDIKKARSLTMLLFALMVVPVMFSKYVDNMWLITIIIAFATAAHQGWGANLMTTVGDKLPNNYVSSVIGFGGMLGSVAGIIFPLFIGIVLDAFKKSGNINGGYNIIFFIAGISYIAAWGIIRLINRNKK